ncbi:hypothetical protein [Enterococcus sp. C76]|uniref:hypothetical protein n=1 Tax=Enterococcus sp. C76 TaxID=3231334 RepID=UPI0034A00EDE
MSIKKGAFPNEKTFLFKNGKSDKHLKNKELKKLLQQSDYRISDIAFEIGLLDNFIVAYMLVKKKVLKH